MKQFIQPLRLFFACAVFGLPGVVLAQTPTLEFATGAGNPTGNGPVTADQVITFQNNTDNPTANTFLSYVPTTTVTFALSNQQYTAAAPGQDRGVMFGGQSNANGTPGPGVFALFPLMNALSGAPSNSFTSTSGLVAGTGIDRDANNAVSLFTDVAYLPNTPNIRYQYADLTITFNQPMVNPVLHIVGLGSNNVIDSNYSTELDLLTTGVTLSKLSGSGELTVNATQILNNTSNPTFTTGFGAASGSVLVSTSSAGITSLQLRVYLRTGNTATAMTSANNTGDGWLLGVSKLTPTVVTGYVFEDVNYGGGAGRPRAASGAVGRAGATVELYDNANNFLATTTTDANGLYTFNQPADTYTVRVVNSTVTSSRPDAVAGLLPVQTYNGTTTAVGGANPALSDAPANAGTQALTALSTGTVTPESIGTVAATGVATAGPDFGYSFDTVVNTNDAGQGSLRQFILNANALGDETNLAQAGSYTNIVNLATGSTAAGLAPVALPAGVETSIFMIPASRLTTGVAVIAPTTALPQITGVNTAINGGTQTFNIGNSNDVLLGAGGTVGTTATALSRLNGPEVQLTGSPAVATGLDIAGAGSRVRGLAIYGFGDNVDDNGSANITTSADNVQLVGNALGSTATSFALPAGANGSADVRVASGTGLNLTNNLVGFAGGSGIYLAPGVTGAAITGNEIRSNGLINTIFDGLDSHGSSTTVTGNLFADGAGQGFDSFSSTGSNNVTGNTFTNNGIGNATSAPQETAAARFYGTGNTFSQNVSSSNYGAGVEVVNGSTTLLTRNSIFNNGNVASANNTAASGQIGIDLVANGGNENAGDSPYVTLNSTTTTGGNGLLNYPILRRASIVGTNLVLTGYAKPGATIELFTAQANPTGVNATGAYFGQGRTYLLTLTEGATSGINDTNSATGQSYGPAAINGFGQGRDANANSFTFTIALASLPGVAGGTLLTSTATLAGATSEFSGNTRVLQTPVPNNVANGSVAGNQPTPVALSPNLSATALGNTSDITTATANTIARYVVNPIATAQGTLYYNGTAVTAATTVLVANIGQLTFQPASGFTGNATFTYTAIDANGVTSTTRSTGGTVTTGSATYTIPVAAPLPVVLTEFTAQAVHSRDAQLSWRTASELSNDHFEVERSFDGTSFAKISQLAGHGTAATALAYVYTDAGVAAKATGLVYYRLRQVDLDGTATYSPLRTISFAHALPVPLTLAPNPAAAGTHLDLSPLPAAASYQARLLDATGRQLRTWMLPGGAAHPLELAGLASGSYLLVVTGPLPAGSWLKQTLRLTKE